MKKLTKEEFNEQRIEQLNSSTEFVGENEEIKKEINRKIRERYSLSDELAIMRKALAKLNINDEQLNEYNAYVEQCKNDVRNKNNN